MVVVDVEFELVVVTGVVDTNDVVMLNNKGAMICRLVFMHWLAQRHQSAELAELT